MADFLMDFDDYTTTTPSINDSHKQTSNCIAVDYSIDWLLFMVVTGSILAEIYTIITIKKNKSLQTYQNLLILKIVWSHLGYNVLGEVLILLVTLLAESVKSEGYCFLRNLDFLCLDMTYYLITMLALDWFVTQYHPNFYQKHLVAFRRWGLWICCLVLLPEALLTSVYCFAATSTVGKVRHVFQKVSFFLCFVSVMVMLIKKRRRPLSMESRKYQYCFTVSWAFLMMCLPRNIYYVLMELYLYAYRTVFHPALIILNDITVAISLSAPLVMVYVLCKFNKHFKVAYTGCCKKKRAETCISDNLENGNADVRQERNVVMYSVDIDQ
ncbi:hypothetical protein GWI33_007548 [Rhynchophorus ferrugineus]|uniref:G-protein coupled receptors family 1 profile domain-containing protein n=1 Tax=Rhynchophorus ferrugineus TaxID=354439 RepID=A0A834MI58_RHYFE|nr:hypothetical protein GWI33_007548 [Rhynchophorus ferrugineus]